MEVRLKNSLSTFFQMGNKQSNKEINKILFDDDLDKPDIYRLISKKGGGELVELAILAHRTKDFSRLDNFISSECKKFLINSGKGENIPLEDINKFRFKYEIVPTKSRSKLDRLCKRKKIEEFQVEYHTKFVCFDLNERGYNGETLLHLCLSNNSFIHDLIAKRLVKLFPSMVKDFCIGDEHFGETALHIAIVNDDPFMMKILLDNGSDLHQRCTGKFFLPDDQKESRQNFLLNEIPTLPIETNYDGLSYFGEYPLSFAAVLNHEDCVRLLLASGADPNRQDSNGNTVLHLLIIHNNFPLFKLLVAYNADLSIKNKQDYTPLTLATELCRQEIFFFILETLREVYWIYADISCAAYPLKHVDTISQNGKIDTKSVLYLILEKVDHKYRSIKIIDTEEHLKLMDGCLTSLLQKKWTTFIKFRFSSLSLEYIYLLHLSTIFRIYSSNNH
ncbi:transient receptor potential cation channel subfamily V member 6-like isoform X2 [Brachionus plicatilis]|uniref:Transient receptor potential cation channel subfamily V member 6-like isoform X2 n=1 Tax=Brachionus plicatilis TaxID=10195 RepID=A0A3M7R974_BRAPC|nr:transient receptor potential cation channel subfamily V member 6-like isoform X2 [Brachionus plicatilis]